MSSLKPALIPGGLARGPHGVPREVVEAHQRERIFIAVAEIVDEEGYAGFTVRKVVRVAGISSKTFYELFADRRDVTVAAYEAIFARLLERVEAACATESGWPAKVRAAIAAAIGFATAEPRSARLLTHDGFVAVGRGRDRVQRSHERVADMLTPGRRHSLRAAKLPPLTELAVAGAIWSAAVDCLDQDVARLNAIEAELIDLALTPCAVVRSSGRRSDAPRKK